MTNKLRTFLSITVVALLLSSCAVNTSRNMRQASLMPNEVRLDLTLDDYEFVGETEVEVEYHRYLGLITYVNTVNGQNVSNNRNYVNLQGTRNVRLDGRRQLRRAMFKAYKEFPAADFLIPTMSTEEVQQMFLGRKVKVSAKVKAYKIRK